MTLTRLEALKTKRHRRQSRRGIAGHTKYVHGFDVTWFHREWIEALEDESIKRLLIITPPKHGKTPIVGLDYLGWKIGNNRNHHVIYASGTSMVAARPAMALRDTISSSDLYRSLYPDVRPDYRKGWSAYEWFVQRDNVSDKDPTLQCTGVHGSVLGSTVDELVLDDVNTQENTSTSYQTEKTKEWVDKTLRTRLVPNGRQVCICTRWSENDLAGEFIKAGWHVITYPAILPDGSLLYPEYWTMEALMEIKAAIGTRAFELIYQCTILPVEGKIFKPQYWKYYDTLEGIKPLKIIQVWDTAFSKESTAHYSAMETWWLTANGSYLVNAWRDKLEFPELKKMAIQLYDNDNADFALIEKKASGQSLIPSLRADTRMNIIPVKPEGDKIQRANSSIGPIEGGKCFLPRHASWLQQWQFEHEVFPDGENDDWVDDTSYYFKWVLENTTSVTIQPRQVTQTSKHRS